MKRIFTIFILCIIFYNANAQIKLGFQLGPNFASGNYSSDYFKESDVSGKTGFFGGVLAEFKLNDMFYLQPEINYIQKGVEISPLYYLGYVNSGSKGDFKLDYVEVPINIIAKFGKNELKPFIFAGPSFNILSTAEKTEKYVGYSDYGPYSIEDYVESMDIALNVGGGVEYAVNPTLDVFAMLRYSLGFTDIFKNVGSVSPTNLSVGDIESFKTRGLVIGLGFKFCVFGCEEEKQVIEEPQKTPIGKVLVKEFDLGKYDIPFYVSGYYRPNTQENLEQLFVLREGELKNATYIEKFDKKSQRYDQYKLWAQSVDNIFKVVYTASVDEIFPKINSANNPDEVLEISVTGYADPRAITGKYLESEVASFVDLEGKTYVVKQGDDLDNLKLSGLRAYYCGKLLDKLFSDASNKGKSDYEELKRDGKIRFVYIGAGVAKDESNLEAQRRIKITMVRTDK